MKKTVDKIDVLQEVINIGVGKGADALNAMVGLHVHLQALCLKILSTSGFEEEGVRAGIDGRLSCVQLPFTGDYSGVAELVFHSDSALRFIAALTQDQSAAAEMDSIRTGTLCEVGNIVLNTVMGTFSNHFGLKFVYSVPSYHEGYFECLVPSQKTMVNATVLFISVNFSIESIEVVGNIILFLEIGSFNKVLELIDVCDEATGS